jgi:hypothetical protein
MLWEGEDLYRSSTEGCALMHDLKIVQCLMATGVEILQAS